MAVLVARRSFLSRDSNQRPRLCFKKRRSTDERLSGPSQKTCLNAVPYSISLAEDCLLELEVIWRVYLLRWRLSFLAFSIFT